MEKLLFCVDWTGLIEKPSDEDFYDIYWAALDAMVAVYCAALRITPSTINQMSTSSGLAHYYMYTLAGVAGTLQKTTTDAEGFVFSVLHTPKKVIAN